MTTSSIEILAEGDKLGECPFWDADHQRLFWSDIHASTIYTYDAVGARKSVYHQGHMTFGLVCNRDGGLIVTGPMGVHYLGGPDDVRPILSEFDGEALFMNDAIADAAGRVYAGTVYWGPEGLVKRGKLYLIDRDRTARIVHEGTGMSNGLGFSPDGRTLYYTDSYEHVIWAFDVDPATGALSGKRTFVQFTRDDGLPDGLTVDAEGNVWSALWYAGRVVCHAPSGARVRTVEVPARQVASVMFGGRDLDELYITSSSVPFRSEALAPAGYDFDAPEPGGALFRVRLGVKGRLEHLADITPPPR